MLKTQKNIFSKSETTYSWVATFYFYFTIPLLLFDYPPPQGGGYFVRCNA